MSPPTITAAASVRVAVTGALDALTADQLRQLLNRDQPGEPDLARNVAAIIEDVRRRGDAALRDQTLRYDGVTPGDIEVPRAAWDRALDVIAPELRAALEQAADAIATFHRAQLPATLEVQPAPGLMLGRTPHPIRSAGVYAPGGRAAYPSSILMGVIPARAAGVRDVAVCSPAGPDGKPPAAVLAACALAGADRLYAAGGAGAIAALAFGTRTIASVDRIVGPGNAYVTEAKRQLAGMVAIDCLAGPSEVLVLDDGSASARRGAAELIAQAEHDPDSAAVLVTTAEPARIEAVRTALERLIGEQPRRAIIEAALAARGALITAPDLESALAFAERYAPEHLLLLLADPEAALGRVRGAGTVLYGTGASVTFGDYLTGANHVLPTGGRARSYAGLSTTDFLRWQTYQRIDRGAALSLAAPTELLARAEGLPGHAAAARLAAADGRAANDAGDFASDDGTANHGRDAATPDVVARTEPVPARRLARAAYRDIELYDPGRAPCAVDLSDNTNLFGINPAVAAALAGTRADSVTRYPSVYAGRLKEAIAQACGVAACNVVTGCGSDGVIDSALRAFCEPGDLVAWPAPTFGMLDAFARMNGARTLPVQLPPDLALDADALADAGARVTYVCRPNNPTGTQPARAAVERVSALARGVVLVDEAYADFAGDDVLDVALASDNMLVLRTFSKAFGIAGLRVGCAIGPPALVAEVEKSRGPYKVGGLAEVAAVAALTAGADWARRHVAVVRENRERLTATLLHDGFTVWPSAANFVLVRVPAAVGTAIRAGAGLRRLGVAVRPFPGLPHAGDCVRVTIGPWPMMEAFLDAWHTLTEEHPR